MYNQLEIISSIENAIRKENNKLNIVRESSISKLRELLYLLVESSEKNKTYDSVKITQEELANKLHISSTRVSEMIKILTKLGLISFVKFQQFGYKEARNCYTFLDKNITQKLRKLVRYIDSSLRASRKSVSDEVSNVKKLYENRGADKDALDIVEKRTVELCNSVSGVTSYFKQTFLTVRKELADIANSITCPIIPTNNLKYNKNPRDNFNNFEQRTFDDDLEWKLLGWKK
jgi:predicted transcriptional regulator